ncbi:hypothetical protein K505DRAFT_197738, partial [Melanomma pulvis-pyrius CBS 109.77]
SSHSHTGSTTSTQVQGPGHEPFATFQSKVLSLCGGLWPTLHHKAFEVTRMSGGVFNRIISIKVDPSKQCLPFYKRWLHMALNVRAKAELPPGNYILRIPRRDIAAWMEFEIFIVKYLNVHTDIPCPSISKFDLSYDNKIGLRYTLQPRVPGRQALLVYQGMNVTQRVCFSRQLGQAINEMSVRAFPYAAYYLTHMDFGPHNMLVDIVDEKTANLKAILDWDSAVFAPPFLNCKSPQWLWAWKEGEEEDETKASDTPENLDDQIVKKAFEEAVRPEYLKYAYTPEYRLARDILRLAIQGISSNDDFRDADAFVERW